MCGRFALFTDPLTLARRFEAEADLPWPPRYNIAPSQTIPIIRQEQGKRHFALARWGLIPRWAKDIRIGYSTFNARAETLAGKPAFRDAVRQRRCLIAADGFYEWAHAGKTRQPYFIRLKENQPLAFAGLWERWEDEGQVMESCTIVVTEANSLMRPIHERMPVILAPEHHAQWLDPEIREPDRIQGLLQPCPAEWLQAYPVGAAVNSVRNDREDLTEPLSLPRQPFQTALF